MAVLSRGNTTITLKPLNNKVEVAISEWEPNKGIDIVIDEFQCALLNGTVHELLHYEFRETHGKNMDYWVEEPQIQALEDEVVTYIRSNSSLFRHWKKTIHGKLGRKQ